MSLFISDAWAEGASSAATGGAAGGGFGSLIFMVLIFVIFYFLLLRPQVKRAKQHKTMVESLAKGDEIVTSGGLLGRISDIGESFVSLEIGEGMNVKVQKNSVASLVPKGTMKAA